jgi:Skp family chaperone for outer membrane proteins
MASRNQSNHSLRSEEIMKASAWLFSVAVSVSGLALAQSAPQSRVTESTDPAKVAEVERRAQELEERKRTTPTMEKKQKAHSTKGKAKQKPAKKEKAPADAPMATEGKG